MLFLDGFEYTGSMHKMGNKMMTGETHTSASKLLTKKPTMIDVESKKKMATGTMAERMAKLRAMRKP